MSTHKKFRLLQNSALADGHPERQWIWHGFVARGETTLLTALWKSGKSTLISVLLARMKEGGTLAGASVAKGRAVVLTEESPTKWCERGRHFGFSDHLSWFCRPFKGKPTYDDWSAIIRQILQIHRATPIDLIVIDPLSNLSPLRSENEAGEMLKAILPLQQLTERGIAILVAHHPRKRASVPGNAARGSGALAGYVDTIIEMHRLSHRHARDRRRQLRAFSRHDETPPNTVIELSADATDYLQLSSSGQLDFARAWLVIEEMLKQADPFQYFSAPDILRNWPEGLAPPPIRTLRDWLNQAMREQRLECQGAGTKREPRRYCLKGISAKWTEEWPAFLYRELGFEPTVTKSAAPVPVAESAPPALSETPLEVRDAPPERPPAAHETKQLTPWQRFVEGCAQLDDEIAAKPV